VSADAAKAIQLGYIAGVHGIRGWVRVHSYTDPRENIVAQRRWTLRQNNAVTEAEVVAGRVQGKTVVAKLVGIDDRDAAAALVGAEISVGREALPACGEGEYYWADLEGMLVRDRQGQELGRVVRLLETGAHDVLVLDGQPERLIPFVLGAVVESVDLDARSLTVTWDAGFWEP
jgi:16S rRNA processing protein RimM